MVIDTSALLALLFNEPEAPSAARILSSTTPLTLSSFTLLETQIVITARKGSAGFRELQQLLHTLKVEIVALTDEQTELAMDAWLQFGKGRHRAGLNIGDCCSYALAAHSRQTLLYKGDDFGATDLKCQHL